MRRTLTVTLLATLAAATTALLARPAPITDADDQLAKQLAAARAPRSADALKDTPLEIMSAFIGNWEIAGTWSDGSEVWARNEYTVGTGGKFIFVRTFAKEEDGDVYERYFTAFSHDESTSKWSSHGFTYDGTVTVVEGVEIGGTVENPTIGSGWSKKGQDVKQTVTLVSPDAYDWKVWTKPTSAGDDAWAQIMDGTWRRVD